MPEPPHPVASGGKLRHHRGGQREGLPAIFFSQVVDLGEQHLFRGQFPQPGFCVIGFHEQQRFMVGNTIDAGAGSLMGGVNPPGGQWFRLVHKIALFQQMTPHLKIHAIRETFVEPAPGVVFSEQRQSGLADQVIVSLEAGDHYFFAVVKAGPR